MNALLDFTSQVSHVYISNDYISGFDKLLTIHVQTCSISCTLDPIHVKRKGNKPNHIINAPVSVGRTFLLKKFFSQ